MGAAKLALADLAGKENITGNEVLEAIQFRALDRKLFERGRDFPNPLSPCPAGTEWLGVSA